MGEMSFEFSFGFVLPKYSEGLRRKSSMPDLYWRSAIAQYSDFGRHIWWPDFLDRIFLGGYRPAFEEVSTSILFFILSFRNT